MYYNRKEYHMTSSYPQSTCIPFTTQGFQHFINGKPQKKLAHNCEPILFFYTSSVIRVYDVYDLLHTNHNHQST